MSNLVDFVDFMNYAVSRRFISDTGDVMPTDEDIKMLGPLEKLSYPESDIDYGEFDYGEY